MPEADGEDPSFLGQEHLLTDGRLDEAVSLALLTAFPELGGVWQARFERDRHNLHQIHALVGLSVARGMLVQVSQPLHSGELRLSGWVPVLRQTLADCVGQVYDRLERELELDPSGRVAQAVVQQCRWAGAQIEPLRLIRHYHRRVLREGASVLSGLEPHRGALNLLFEIAADARAELLLARQLGPDYATLERSGHVEVPSRLFPKRVYRVRRGQRIQVIDSGRCTAELCMESGVKLPEADEFLMKVVWLRANEEYVLRTANHFPAARLLL